MPRAEPSRSRYCASRHLLRNLDDPRELRRNPLVAGYFPSTSRSRRRMPAEDRLALDRIRGLVREALGALHASAEGDCDGARLGRMHAALLRCEIDRQAPEIVAAELGLSERQLRRERSAAHEAFLRGFGRAAEREPLPATVCVDIAQLRLAEAVELHAVGKSSLGLAVFASIAQAAPHTATRLEALCLATEAELDAGRIDEARALVAEVNVVLPLHGAALSDAERAAAGEHLEFLEWAVRWQLGIGAGVAMRPPSIVTNPAAGDDRSEARRALRVRALAAFAGQRWDVGDVPQGREAVRLAQALMPSLRESRVKERLAVMHIDLRLFALRGSVHNEDHPRLLAIEALAGKVGHVRPLVTVRAERLSTETEQTRPTGLTFDDVFAEIRTAERGSMRRTFAYVACVAAQWERDPRRAIRSAELAQQLVPAGSATDLLARSMQLQWLIARGHHSTALPIAEAARTAAERCGNDRFRGGVERHLAMIALAQGRPRDARRLIRGAMPAVERYGSRMGFAEASKIARRVGVG
jgi:hypothetical protein